MSRQLSYLAGRRRDATAAYAEARRHHRRSAGLGQKLARATTALLRAELREGKGCAARRATPTTAAKPDASPDLFTL